MSTEVFRLSIGDNIELRLLEERHTDELFAVVDKNRAYLREWLPWLDATQTVEDERAFIRACLEKFAAGEGLATGIWYRGRMVGGIGLNAISQTDRRAAVGYWVSEELQGLGLVTRSCRALLSYAFDELKLNRVEIFVAPGNTRSHAIPQRLGFIREGTVRQMAWHYDHFLDLVLYGMLASEWRAQKSDQGEPQD